MKRLKDGVLEPVTDDDVALGTSSSKRFTNLFLRFFEILLLSCLLLFPVRIFII